MWGVLALVMSAGTVVGKQGMGGETFNGDAMERGDKMKSTTQFFKRLVSLVGLLMPMFLMAQVPNIDAVNQTNFQGQTHFLTFLGSYKPESPTSATAYYAAVDPYNQKVTFQGWLVAAGFIANEGQWHSTGRQIVACDLGAANGCDLPSHNPD